MTKKQFAAAKRRTQSCVSNWIAAGKITKTALIGDGVRARIWLEQAERDLAASLDPIQQALQERDGRGSALVPYFGGAPRRLI